MDVKTNTHTHDGAHDGAYDVAREGAHGAPTGALALVLPTALGVGGQGGAGLGVPVPFANRIVLLEDAYVAGTTHVHDIDRIAAALEAGQELALERDTANMHDAWAIRVLAGDQKIGYVPADRNEVLARLMDGGKRLSATVTELEVLGSWHKIHMEVYLDD